MRTTVSLRRKERVEKWESAKKEASVDGDTRERVTDQVKSDKRGKSHAVEVGSIFHVPSSTTCPGHADTFSDTHDSSFHLRFMYSDHTTNSQHRIPAPQQDPKMAADPLGGPPTGGTWKTARIICDLCADRRWTDCDASATNPCSNCRYFSGGLGKDCCHGRKRAWVDVFCQQARGRIKGEPGTPRLPDPTRRKFNPMAGTMVRRMDARPPMIPPALPSAIQDNVFVAFGYPTPAQKQQTAQQAMPMPPPKRQAQIQRVAETRAVSRNPTPTGLHLPTHVLPQPQPLQAVYPRLPVQRADTMPPRVEMSVSGPFNCLPCKPEQIVRCCPDYPQPMTVLPPTPCWLSQGAFYVPPTIYVFEANSAGYPQPFDQNPHGLVPVQGNRPAVVDYRPPTANLLVGNTAVHDAPWSGAMQAGLAPYPNARQLAAAHPPANTAHTPNIKLGKRRREESHEGILSSWKKARTNEE